MYADARTAKYVSQIAPVIVFSGEDKRHHIGVSWNIPVYARTKNSYSTIEACQ